MPGGEQSCVRAKLERAWWESGCGVLATEPGTSSAPTQHLALKANLGLSVTDPRNTRMQGVGSLNWFPHPHLSGSRVPFHAGCRHTWMDETQGPFLGLLEVAPPTHAHETAVMGIKRLNVGPGARVQGTEVSWDGTELRAEPGLKGSRSSPGGTDKGNSVCQGIRAASTESCGTQAPHDEESPHATKDSSSFSNAGRND